MAGLCSTPCLLNTRSGGLEFRSCVFSVMRTFTIFLKEFACLVKIYNTLQVLQITA